MIGVHHESLQYYSMKSTTTQKSQPGSHPRILKLYGSLAPFCQQGLDKLNDTLLLVKGQ